MCRSMIHLSKIIVFLYKILHNKTIKHPNNVNLHDGHLGFSDIRKLTYLTKFNVAHAFPENRILWRKNIIQYDVSIENLNTVYTPGMLLKCLLMFCGF